MNITSTRPPFFVSFSFAVLVCLMLAVGTWVLPARVMLLSGDVVRDALLADTTVTPEALSVLVQSRKQSLAWRPISTDFGDLALAMTKMPKPTNSTISQARSWQEQALGRAPADTYGWSRLAYILWHQGQPSPHTIQAFANSLATNPYEPGLMVSRVTLAVRLLEQLPPDLQRQVPAIIHAAWKTDPYGLAQSARDNHYTDLIEKNLSDELEVKQFQKILAQKISKYKS